MKLGMKETAIYGLVGVAGLLSLWGLVTQPMFGLSSMTLLSQWTLTLVAIGWAIMKFLNKDYLDKIVFLVVGIVGLGTIVGQLTLPGFGLNLNGIQMYLLGISSLLLGIERLFHYDLVEMKRVN